MKISRAVSHINCTGDHQLTLEQIDSGNVLFIGYNKDGEFVRLQASLKDVIPALKRFLYLQQTNPDLQQTDTEESMFPILDGHEIPWSIAVRVYKKYCKQHGKFQSMEEIAKRGGFSRLEVEGYLEPWEIAGLF